MAFRVRFRITRPSTDLGWINAIGIDNESDRGLVPAMCESNGGTVEVVHSEDELTMDTIYTFESPTEWQAFYNEALPVWNNNGLTAKAAENSVTFDVAVIENT
jgi:hypothetical protein